MIMQPNDPTRTASAPPRKDVVGDDRFVHLSLSEILALCTKAARGAGHDWGLAEEAGHAATWLAHAALPGPEMLLTLLEKPALAAARPAKGYWAAPDSPLCPLRAGVALADHAGLEEGPGTAPLKLEAVACPAFLLPFAAAASRRLGHGLHLICCGAVLDPCAGPISQLASRQRLIWGGSAEVVIVPSGRPGQVRQRPVAPQRHHGTISIRTWQALDAFALRITVPPSDLSRAGAGGSGDDND